MSKVWVTYNGDHVLGVYANRTHLMDELSRQNFDVIDDNDDWIWFQQPGCINSNIHATVHEIVRGTK